MATKKKQKEAEEKKTINISEINIIYEEEIERKEYYWYNFEGRLSALQTFIDDFNRKSQ